MNNNPNPSDRTYNLDFEKNPMGQPQNRPSQGQPSQGQRRPMTEEERRRLAAARAAGMRMNNGTGGAGTNPNAMPRMNPNGHPQNYSGQRRPNPNGYPAQGQRRPNPAPNGQYPAGNGRPQNPEAAMGRRRRRRVHINAGAVIFVLLIGAVVGISAFQISRHSETLIDDSTPTGMESILQNAQNSTEISDVPTKEEISGETAEESVPAAQSSVVAVQNSAIDEGNLVLVNFEYAYGKIDDVTLMNAYNERTGKIKVSSTTLGMEPEAFAALEELVSGLVEDTGCDDLLLYSGHRTLADQQRIWDSNMTNYGEDYTKTYVAVPGHSEHHTGLACDLGFYTDDGLSIPLVDHEYGTWVWDHCTEYGYILRYPEDKANLTGIGHEQWHFRYIGIPHAYAVDALDLCLEEYLDELKNYTPETKMLHISADRDLTDVTADNLSSVSGGWLTYYVPAAEGDTTEITIPQMENYAEHTISGNNVDGFIVTITLN